MIRIAVTQAAFDAIAKTLALGSTGYENAVKRAGRAAGVWLDRAGCGATAVALWSGRELFRRYPAGGGGSTMKKSYASVSRANARRLTKATHKLLSATQAGLCGPRNTERRWQHVDYTWS